MSERRDWPALPWDEWCDTADALHLWCQILGKYRVAHTPWAVHSWHATLYVVPRGLTTGPVPDGRSHITLTLDVCDSQLVVESDSGARESTVLESMSVAEFLARTRQAVEAVGGNFDIHNRPNELPDPVLAFEDDRDVRPYDADAVQRFHQALVSIDRVFSRFRTGWLGKGSPSHLFWGSFDLAVSRFSGRTAPTHPGGVPNLPDVVAREAYSHEVSSAGFWPGNGGTDEPMFYAYCYPTLDSFRHQTVEPAEAYWDANLGEFLLPYEIVRTAHDPEVVLEAFLQSTYEAAANTANWDREALECELGVPRCPRPI